MSMDGLVVTPPALTTQWEDELAAHASDLKVFVLCPLGAIAGMGEAFET